MTPMTRLRHVDGRRSCSSALPYSHLLSTALLKLVDGSVHDVVVVVSQTLFAHLGFSPARIGGLLVGQLGGQSHGHHVALGHGEQLCIDIQSQMDVVMIQALGGYS